MCGLIGFVNLKYKGFTSNDLKAFDNLLYMDTLRGSDATGVASYLTDNSATIIKSNISAPEFLNSLEWKEIAVDAIKQGIVLLGHNRKRTLGANTEENAHPYYFDDRYIFLHNGTISNWRTLIPDTKHEVDSIVLGELLTKCEGNIAQISELRNRIFGAYACIWLDLQKKILYILRNKERPLFYGTTVFGYSFASEGPMLLSALSRNSLIPQNIKSFETDILYSLQIDDTNATFKEEPLVKNTFTPSPIIVMGEKIGTVKDVKQGKKKLIGSRITFWLDDYQALYPAAPQTENWFAFGQSTDLPYKNHVVKANFLKTPEEEMVTTWTTSLCSGTVTEIAFDKATSQMNVWVNQVQEVPSSLLNH